MRRLIAWPAAIATLLVVAACGGSPLVTQTFEPQSKPTQPAQVGRAGIATASTSSIVIDSHWIDQAAAGLSNAKDHEAIQSAISSCMERAGFEYEQAPFFPFEFAPENRFGITDVESASISGYGSTDADGFDLTNNGLANLDVQARQRWSDAFFGRFSKPVELLGDVELSVASGGCLEEGENAVYNDRLAYHGAVMDLQLLLGNAWQKASETESVVAATNRWRTCMAEAGLAVDDFEDARRAVGTDRELEMAVADATCNLRTGLAETWSREEAAALRRLNGEERVALERVALAAGIPIP